MNASTSDINRTRRFVTTFVDHSRLLRLNAEYIGVLLCRYDENCKRVAVRAEKLVKEMTSKPIRRVNIKFCLDSE